MTNDRPARGDYRVSSRLLAKKGGAEPLSNTGSPLILARDKDAAETDETRLTDAVIDATIDVLTEPPGRRRSPQAAAPLTDLLDPALIGAARRQK